MTNVQQNPSQKTQEENRSSNPANQSNPSKQNPQLQDKNNDRLSSGQGANPRTESPDANRKGGMQNDPQNRDRNRVESEVE